MRAKLARLASRFPDEVKRALYIETEIEVKEVKRRTPVDKGPLRASVHQQGPDRSGVRTIGTAIVAGGTAAPYAIYVHENLDAFHAVGQAKFIESVILEARPHMGRRVAKRIELHRALA
jgi:hypothetical protein